MKEILLTSPNSLTPKKFRTTINTANIVIHAAGGTGVSQNCKIVAAALMSVGTTMAIVYPRSKQVSYAHEYAHRDDGRRGAVTKKNEYKETRSLLAIKTYKSSTQQQPPAPVQQNA
jgi:hypothetical protein